MYAYDNNMLLLQGVRLTKDLVGAPANFVTPRYLADTARQIAKASTTVKASSRESKQAAGWWICLFVCLFDVVVG